MEFNKLTTHSARAIDDSISIAVKKMHADVTVRYVLLVLINKADCIAHKTLDNLKIDLKYS